MKKLVGVALVTLVLLVGIGCTEVDQHLSGEIAFQVENSTETHLVEVSDVTVSCDEVSAVVYGCPVRSRYTFRTRDTYEKNTDHELQISCRYEGLTYSGTFPIVIDGHQYRHIFTLDNGTLVDYGSIR